MNISKFFVPLFVVPNLIFAQSSFAQNNNQKLTMHAKPAVVRIVGPCKGFYKWHPDGNEENLVTTVTIDKNFIGTGFLINPNGYIVTSADVMEFEKDCRQSLKRNIQDKILRSYGENLTNSYIEDPKKGTFNITFSKHFVYLPSSLNYLSNLKNHKPFEIKVSGRDQGEATKINRDVAVLKVYLENAPTLKLGDSSKVQIQDEVITVGYPISADIELDEDLTEESYFEASVQAGRISNPNKKIQGGYPVFQVDITAAEGSAGSPLINNKNEVVGMLTYKKSYNNKNEVVPIAIPSNTLQEFIRQSGTLNEQSETDRLYTKGLQNLWQGNYKEAKAKFVRVKGLFSFHSEVDRLISKINQIEAERWDKPLKNPTYQILLALVLGSAVIATVVYFSLSKKSSKKNNFVSEKKIPTQNDILYPPSVVFVELEFQGNTFQSYLHKSEHYLGRDPKWADIKVPDNWDVVSRHHAILKKEGADYCIYDGDGTKLSKNRLWTSDDTLVDPKKGYLLKNGEKLKIGQNIGEQVTLSYFTKQRMTKMADPETRK